MLNKRTDYLAHIATHKSARTGQPAKDLVIISLSHYYEPTVEVKIIDVDGREVSSNKLIVNSGKAHLETSELSNGVYLLQITNSKQQTVSKRLVIAK